MSIIAKAYLYLINFYDPNCSSSPAYSLHWPEDIRSAAQVAEELIIRCPETQVDVSDPEVVPTSRVHHPYRAGGRPGAAGKLPQPPAAVTKPVNIGEEAAGRGEYAVSSFVFRKQLFAGSIQQAPAGKALV